MTRRTARAGALALLLCAACSAALAQAGPDDGPDLTLTGYGAEDWLVVCRGQTIFGDPLYAEAGGAAYGVAPGARFARVGALECTIDAGVMAPLTLRMEKAGGEFFCPLTGRRGGGDCVAVFGPGERGEFRFEAVP